MPRKSYKNQENAPETVAESAVAYRDTAHHVSTNRWNPNVPFHGIQEEWWEHFHQIEYQIEQGQFSTWEEHKKKFNAWKKEYLASRI
jgi:hypothetical protein